MGAPRSRASNIGAYNLSYQYGTHRFVNNQTGHAVGPTVHRDNFIPIDSVTLTTT